MKPSVFRTGLDLLHYSGLSRLARPFTGGCGAIFMLHHVRPSHGRRGFAPNAGLDVTPEFLDAVIGFVKARGWRLLSLEEAAEELRGGVRRESPFAVFTLDDGFRDNLEHALPVFRGHDCPFTVFAAPAYVDGKGELWWDALEEVIAISEVVRPGLDGVAAELLTRTDEERRAAWETIYWPVRGMEQHAQREWIRRFADAHGVDLEALCRREVMGWDELRTLAADPLCSIGAHTVHHYAVALLDADEAFAEMTESKVRLESELGVPVRTFAYPYGDAGSAGPRDFTLAGRAGFDVAVTTRKGLVYPEHVDHLMALPRVSLNGFYQKIRHVDVLLSGVPFVLFNGLKRLDVA